MGVFPVLNCIFGYKGSQQFSSELND
jgi:hypothetical protein